MGANRGKLIAGNSGHGLRSCPDSFTMRAASQVLISNTTVASDATIGGASFVSTSVSMSFALSSPPARLRSPSAASMADRRLLWKLSASVPKYGIAITMAAAPSTAVQSTILPAGYHSSVAGAVGGAGKQREIAKPPGGQADADDEGEREMTIEHEGKAGRGE